MTKPVTDLHVDCELRQFHADYDAAGAIFKAGENAQQQLAAIREVQARYGIAEGKAEHNAGGRVMIGHGLESAEHAIQRKRKLIHRAVYDRCMDK